MNRYDTIIIGAGAAGVMAAGVAASRGAKVLLCERMEKAQRKVRITGKGRCNLTNLRTEAEFLERIRSGEEFFKPSFRRFNNQATVAFFEQIGVKLITERGERVFPESGRAWDIAQAHIDWCTEQGAQIEYRTRALRLIVENNTIQGAELQSAEGVRIEPCQRVILATGGASYPATGSTGDGYRLAHEVGHRIEAIRPSLTGLDTRAINTSQIKGLTLKNTLVRLEIDGKVWDEIMGEVELSERGVAGAAILRLSRDAVDALISEHKVSINLDLKPALSAEVLAGRIEREIKALPPHATVRHLSGKLLPSALINPLLKYAGLSSSTPLTRLRPSECKALIQTLKNFRLPIYDYRPFEEAIVTAGGVDLEEVDPHSLQSKLVGGLYFAGELLDLDGDTGGFNLQIAYSTGHLAGELNP